MTIDPEIANLLQMINAMPEADLSAPGVVESLRTQLDGFNAMLGEGPADVTSVDRTIPGPDGDVPVRVFHPEGVDRPGVLVYFHGGGFAIGSVEGFDRECRLLADGAGVAVVSVEYRLAPEAPFPAGADDCYAAVRWVADHADELGVDADRMAVGGDSAGGNLSASTALRSRDEAGPALRFQLLVYPVVDLSSSLEEHAYPSLLENAEGYFLEASTMEAFQRWYLPDAADRTNPLASPILAESLAGLPPALVLTCEYDPLRDEGEAYAKALANAGVDVTLSRYDGAIHGLFSMSRITAIGARFMDEAVAAVRAAIGPA